MRLRIPIVAVLVLIAAAFWLAPSACEGGLNRYALIGAIAVALAIATPWIGVRGPRPVAQALAGSAIVIVGWWIGLVAADFQLLCRLF